MSAHAMREWAATNWFVLLLAPLGAAGFLIGRSDAWTVAGGGGLETALLIDACVTVPLLCFLCYRRRMPSWQMALRLIGLVCGGIFLLGYLIPPEGQVMLPHLSMVRTVGLGLLITFEVWLLATALRLVFRADTTADQIQAATGAPPFVAKLMLIEARFWKAVARFFWRR